MTHRTRFFLLATIGVPVLFGCGGSGGGSDDGGSPAATAATITAANAPAIASAVMGTALEGGELGAFVSVDGTVAMQKPSQSPVVYAKAASLQGTWLDALTKPNRLGIPQAPIGPETSPCAGGGTATVTGDVGDPSAVSVNDRIVVDFDQCREGDTTVDGRFALTVTSYSGDVESGTFAFGITAEFTDFRVTVGTEEAVADGGFTLTMSGSSATLTMSIVSDSIAVSQGGQSHTLSNYSFDQTLTGNAFTLDTAGTLTSTAFAGSVTFQTVTTLEGIGGGYAHVGEVLITGANGATIRVVALDSTLVRLQVDSNGDGVIDQSIDTSWTDLV